MGQQIHLGHARGRGLERFARRRHLPPDRLDNARAPAVTLRIRRGHHPAVLQRPSTKHQLGPELLARQSRFANRFLKVRPELVHHPP
ncbi:hypothetical protein G6F57_012320 [Rhizopus arrhizus]|nr:hypothetical protein G6F57_012320 [Rhizopus arrhizus]